MKTYLATILALSLAGILPSVAQESAFTYQGRLTSTGAPVNGNYDLRFIVYNAEVGGSAVGNVLTNPAVVVTDGLFTTLLDFGPTNFDGTARWLEISVRTNGAGTFSGLNPRQPINSTPYAFRAATATTALAANSAASVPAAGVSGKLGDAQISTNVALLNATQTFSGLVIFSNVTAAGTFSGNGSGLTNLAAGARRLFYVQGQGNDNTDSGIISGRTLNFTKAAASSRLRISYTDNFRVTGSNASATWEVKLDGASISPSCAFAVYIGSSLNLHLPHTLVGYAPNVPAGAHSLTVTVGATPGFPIADAYTGWNNATFVLEVEEIP